MAYTLGLCSRLQTSINQIAGNNAPALSRQKVGAIDALMSDVNRNGFTATIVPTNGKSQVVQINYTSQMCDDAVSTSCTPNCTPTVTPEPNEQLITSFLCASTKMTFSEDEMRKLCESDSAWVGQQIFKSFNAINTSVDKAILAALEALTTTATDVALYTENGMPNPLAHATIMNWFDQIGINGNALLIGGSNFNIYAKSQQIACCNTVAGVDISQLNANGYFYSDPFLNGVIDANAVLGFAPGVAQLVTWNKYKGDYAKKNDVFEHGTIIDPFTGLEYDLKTYYDSCAETWYVEVKLHWRLWTAPAAWCGADSGGDALPIHTFNDCSAGPVGCPVVTP